MRRRSASTGTRRYRRGASHSPGAEAALIPSTESNPPMPRPLLVLSLCIATSLTVGAAACSRGAEEGAPRASSTADAGLGRGSAPLDTTVIPPELRHLAPLASAWGVGDDVDRSKKVDGSTPEERTALRAAVLPHDARITAWLDSFPQGSVMPDEAAAFMYMLLAIEEMPQP